MITAAQNMVTQEQANAVNAAPAPSDPVEKAVSDLTARIQAAEAVLSKWAPLISIVEGMASTFVPGAGPVITDVNQVGLVVNDLILSLNTHFGGKIALPAPIQPAPVPPASIQSGWGALAAPG